MKPGEVLLTHPVHACSNEIKLDQVYPIQSLVRSDWTKCAYFVDEIPARVNDDQVVYTNRICFHSESESLVELVLGKGYYVQKDEEWNARFAQKQGWSGGDGIYSFNLTTGKDQFDMKRQFTSLFVFGDTFYGRTDKTTKRRYEPLLMPNNSMGILDANNNRVEFLVNTTEKGSVTAFFSIDPAHDVKGTLPQNLVRYDQAKADEGWISGTHPKKVWLLFDLHAVQDVDTIRIHNYFSPEDPSLSSRGVRIFRLLASKDQKSWTDLGEYELSRSITRDDVQSIAVAKAFRYFQFDIHSGNGIGNHGDEYNEGVFALSKVEFVKDEIKYRDITVDSSSIMLSESAKSWIWLQDGCVIGKQLYFFPYQVISDLSQPEGLQFGIMGISMIRVPIVDNRIDFKRATQKRTPFLLRQEGSELAFGGAVTPNTIQAGAPNPDGYVYVYGYKTTWGFRQLIAARVLEADFECFDRWEFYDGSAWTRDVLRSAPILDHLSTEFSISPILKGRNKGKYLAVFTYDTNTPYIAISLGESLIGPFDNPQIVYKTPEQEIFKSTTYTYNAKAHPQLSESDSILVTYNTNTYNFEHNMSNCDIYGPRFLRLREW